MTKQYLLSEPHGCNARVQANQSIKHDASYPCFDKFMCDRVDTTLWFCSIRENSDYKKIMKIFLLYIKVLSRLLSAVVKLYSLAEFYKF